MTCRNFLTVIVAFAGGVMFGAMHFKSAEDRPQYAAAQGQSEEVLRDEVERLKQKATDQAHVMVSVSYHFNNLWFAAQHRNWPLAEFYLNETRSHLRWAVRVIPVRKNSLGQDIDLRPLLESLESSALQQLEHSIKAHDPEKFVDSYKFMLEGCRSCHGTSEKGFIRTRIPTQPADPMVDFEPPPEAKKPEGADAQKDAEKGK